MPAAETEKFKLLYSVEADGNIPVSKYRSERTGLTICIANVDGPLVNGYFCLGKFDDRRNRTKTKMDHYKVGPSQNRTIN